MPDPVIPNPATVDPSQIVIGDGDDERIIPAADSSGLTAEIKRLRGERRALSSRLTQTAGERDALAKEKEALTQQIAEVEALKADAEAYREIKRREVDTLKEANAARIKALTPEQAKAFEGLTDEGVIARMLTLIPAAAPTPAYPSGGAAPIASPVGEDLTPAEEAWVREQRKDLIGVDNAVIKKMFRKHGPK